MTGVGTSFKDGDYLHGPDLDAAFGRAVETGTVGDETVTPAGGDVSLTIAELSGALFNVKGKGAINDGSSDNTVAFNNSLLSVGVPGAYFIPPGKWNVTYAPAATQTTPVCFMLGANLLGNGFVEGNTDGSALGNVTGENSCGAAFIQALADGYNQSVLVVQSDMPDWAGTTSVQKNGIYSNVRNHQVSAATGSPAYTKDTVAVAGLAEIGAGNPQGRIWAADLVGSVPAGADGQVTVLEISLQNEGGDQAGISTATSKMGLGVYSQGAVFGTSGIEIGSNFHYALTFYGCNGTFVWWHLSENGSTIYASLDTQGNLFAHTVQTNGYTVATLPAGKAGMRAHVTDAASPSFLQPLTGGGATTCPAFHNGSAWVAG